MAKSQPVILTDATGAYVSGGGGTSNVTQWNGNTVSTNNGAADAGTLRVTLANNGTGAVALNAGTNVIGQVNLAPQTSGGLSISSTIWPNNTTAVVVKSGAGQLYGWALTNNSATIAYLKVYNATSATAGSGTPVMRRMIPAPAAGGGGGVVESWPNGIAFSTGITVIITTGIADNDTGTPTANVYTVEFYYK